MNLSTREAAVSADFAAPDYDLATTLASGQAFGWQYCDEGCEGVVQSHWVRLCSRKGRILAQTVEPVADWHWLKDYLQLQVHLPGILATFPQDEPMQAAVQSCRGLRLLRQDPWESLVCFICSSTKQIVQIQQIISLLRQRFGEPIPVPAGHLPAYAFPTVTRLASLGEDDLRACKMGFRAPNLLATARKIAQGDIDLPRLAKLSLEEARFELTQCPGVGPKIADCVLLFGYGFPQAFPMDVWIIKALNQLYFPRRKATVARLRRFTQTHFGPNAGYAQQYLFHYMRTGKPVVS